MKTLYLLRHCKAGSTPANAGDHERTLLESGIADAEAMGQYLNASGAKPTQALCSTAVRVEETFAALAKAFSGPITAKPERALYSTTAGGILARIKETDTDTGELLMIGHVPAIQELALAVCGGSSPELLAGLAARFSSGALATLTFDIADWTGVGLRAGTLTAFVSPEQLPKS